MAWERVLAVNPGDAWAHACVAQPLLALIAAVDALHGRTDAAAQAMARVRAVRPQATVSLFRKTVVGHGPALQAGNARYLAGLLKAVLPP